MPPTARALKSLVRAMPPMYAHSLGFIGSGMRGLRSFVEKTACHQEAFISMRHAGHCKTFSSPLRGLCLYSHLPAVETAGYFHPSRCARLGLPYIGANFIRTKIL